MEESKKTVGTQIQWYPGHMAQAKKTIKENLGLVDMVLQVLDARAPQSSLNPDLEELIFGKPQILIFNKADLANPQITKSWMDHYRKRGYRVVAVNASQKKGIRELLAEVQNAAEPLMARFKSRGREPRPARAMVVGIPNTGKSTIINAIAPSAAAKTGNKPGVTRGRQWIRTGSFAQVDLLDTPGVLWPKFASFETAFNLAVVGSISDLVYPVHEVAEKLLLWLAGENPQAIIERYKLDKEVQLPTDADSLLELIGKSRGLLGPGGIVRTDDASLLFLQEFRSGKLGRYTLEKPQKEQEEKVEKKINE